MSGMDNGASLRDRAVVNGAASVSAVPASVPSAWHHSHIERPQECSRIVILYFDGSGARVGFWTGESIIDEVGDEIDWDDEPGEMWAYLPNGFTLWIETRQEDPYTFPAQGMAAATAGETERLDPKGNSPVPNGDAPLTPSTTTAPGEG